LLNWELFRFGPLTTDQPPAPVDGVLADSVALDVIHNIWSDPALEVGGFTLVITTLSSLVQLPNVVLQRNVLLPSPKPVTPEVGADGVVTVPEPLTRLHAPVPEDGVLPDKVAEVVHTVWSGPAFEVVGAGFTVRFIGFEVPAPTLRKVVIVNV